MELKDVLILVLLLFGFGSLAYMLYAKPQEEIPGAAPTAAPLYFPPISPTPTVVVVPTKPKPTAARPTRRTVTGVEVAAETAKAISELPPEAQEEIHRAVAATAMPGFPELGTQIVSRLAVAAAKAQRHVSEVAARQFKIAKAISEGKPITEELGELPSAAELQAGAWLASALGKIGLSQYQIA